MNAIGIDIGGTQIKAVLVDAHGQILRREMRPTDDDGTDAKHFAHRVRELVQELGPELPVGIAAPGIVTSDYVHWLPQRLHGIVKLEWTRWLGRSRRVHVLNDAHAAATGELWIGAAMKFTNSIVLTLGTGVGGALILDRKVVRGSTGRAGHFGHMGIDLHSATSSIVGMPGALECFVGNYNIRARTGGRFSSTHELVAACQSGDEGAQKYWLESVRALGLALASLTNVFDPEAIIVGGGIAQAGDALFVPLREAMLAFEWQPFRRGVPVIPAVLGEWAGAIGAAREAFQYYPEQEQVSELFRIMKRLTGARWDASQGMLSLQGLLRANPPLDEKDEDGCTAYMKAVRGGALEAAQLLKEAGASTAGHWEAELAAATWGGEAARMEVALKNGADPNWPYFTGWSCLSHCAHNGCDDAVEVLLRYGAKVGSYQLFDVCTWETSDWKTDTEEEERSYARIVQLLIEHGADPNIRDSDGKTPLEAIEGDRLLLIEKVLKDALRARE